MKKLLLIGIWVIAVNSLPAQVAMDFNMTDCNDTMHHLYTDYLDNEEVVIIEFFMTCPTCIQVGQNLSTMFDQLLLDYPGQINFFAFNFADYLDCSVANNFVNDNNIHAIPFDSGEVQLDYYGGFGMPSVVIVGGSHHAVIYLDKTSDGVNDTAAMDSVIRDFFNTVGIEDQALHSDISVYPNPASNFINVKIKNIDGQDSYLKIVNMLGIVVYEKPVMNNCTFIDISNMTPGPYFFNIYMNGNWFSKKIIVDKE